jgi:hypothetical protein
MLLGAVAGIITLIGVARRGTPRLARASALLTAVPLLATLATVNDAINWYGHSMSQWYAMNLRYPFHLAVFAILAIMGLAHWLTTLRAPARASNRALSEAAHPQGQALSGEPGRAPDRASNRLRGREWGRPAARWMLVGIALLVFAVGQPYVMETVKVGWKLKPGAALAQTSGVLLVDSLQGAYLAAGPALSVFTPEARDILAAETVEELEAALDAHGITAIWSWRSYRLQYWKDAPLGEYLADPANFVAVDNKTPGPFPSATYPLYRLYERL